MTEAMSQNLVVALIVLLPIIFCSIFLYYRQSGSRGRGRPRQVAPHERRAEPALESPGVGATDVGGMPRGLAVDEPSLSGEADQGGDSGDGYEDAHDRRVVRAGEPGGEGPAEPAEADAIEDIREDETEARGEPDVAARGDEDADHREGGLDSFGLPEGEAPEMPEQAAATDAREGFPDIDPEQLKPYFHYMVCIEVDGGMGFSDIHEMATELSSKSKLRMNPKTLGYDRGKGRWEMPRNGKTYRELLWAVPLCNRNSKVTPADTPVIVSVIQNAMRKVGGVAEFPPHNDVEERLEVVDEFCEHVDHRVTANLMALASSGGSPQRCGDIIDIAEASGLEMIEGVLCKQVNGESWFTLEAGSGQSLARTAPDRMIASLVASMDFPNVFSPLEAFDEMVALCEKIARVLRFEFVDDSNKPIEREQLDMTRVHLADLNNYMLDNGVRPGSGLARSLFS